VRPSPGKSGVGGVMEWAPLGVLGCAVARQRSAEGQGRQSSAVGWGAAQKTAEFNKQITSTKETVGGGGGDRKKKKQK